MLGLKIIGYIAAKNMIKTLIAVLCTCLVVTASGATSDPNTSLSQAVDQLLKAYSSKSIDQFLNLTDPQEILILGTDISEIADSRSKARQLIEADFKLWGSAEFGQRTFTSIRASDHLASVAFDVPFTMHRAEGRTDTMTIRFLTVWKWTESRWLLTQSLNSVPTAGQSASDINKPKGD